MDRELFDGFVSDKSSILFYFWYSKRVTLWTFSLSNAGLESIQLRSYPLQMVNMQLTAFAMPSTNKQSITIA